jgi:hypothetical protein
MGDRLGQSPNNQGNQMKSYMLTGAATLVLGACAPAVTPLPDIASQQSVASATQMSASSYRDPLAGYTDRTPSGPRNWRQVNDEQTEGN